MGMVWDVVYVVLYLLFDEVKFVMGVLFFVDGG